MNYKRQLKSNIWKYFVFEGLWALVFFFPIYQLFYLARGMNITQIAFIAIAFSTVVLLLEVPSGMLADRWGRKKTLFLSQTFLITCNIVVIYAHSVWMFMISSAIAGLWWVCYSGTATAFLYDTLKELKRDKEYEKLSGRLYLMTSVASFIAAFSAGFIFNISMMLPYILSAVTGFLSLFVIMSFTEPRFHKPAEEQGVFLHFKSSVTKVITSEHLVFIVIFSAILSSALDYVFAYAQIYFKHISIPVFMFGIIFAFGALIEGLGGWSADKIKTRYNYKDIFSASLLSIILLVFALSYLNNHLGILIFLATMFIHGMFRIIGRGYINRKVESHNRATINSISTFGMALLLIIFEPIAGRIADIYSIQASFFIMGCILLVYTVYFFITKFDNKRIFDR